MKKTIIGLSCAAVIGVQPINQPVEALFHFGHAEIAGIELRYEKALTEAEEVIAKAETEPEYRQEYKGKVIAAQALTWRGVSYLPGTPAMCASWVRHVLEKEGITLADVPVDKGGSNPQRPGSLGPLMADSFFSPEAGTIILDPKYLTFGDIVMFSNTYNGGGRYLNGGKITHVGIIVSDCTQGGECMMVDRPTKNGPVKYRSISTFKFNSALRPHIYSQPSSNP